LLFPLGRLDACLEAHEQAYRYALEASSSLEIARALGGLGDAYYQRGQMITARHQFAQCVQEARSHNLAGVLLANLPMLAITEIYYGTPNAGREHLKEALDLATRIGDLRNELLIYLCYCEGFLIQAQYDDARTRAARAVDLARQLGARRFQAECTGILAFSTLALGRREEALQIAKESVQVSRETGMSYCGPVLLSLVARTTENPAERERALEEGEALLAAGCVSHSYINFYMHAIEVSLEQERWNEARRYASALETYTATEPLPFTNLLVQRARALANLGEGVELDATRAALETLRGECMRMNARSALIAIDAALAEPAAA
jgi:tetratricopeptide (TPR) repeat protein